MMSGTACGGLSFFEGVRAFGSGRCLDTACSLGSTSQTLGRIFIYVHCRIGIQCLLKVVAMTGRHWLEALTPPH